MRPVHRPRWVRRAAALAGVACLAVLPACGGDGEAADVELTEFETIEPDVLPKQVLDLRVKPEERATTLKKGEEAFIDEMGFFSFRKGKLLQATLQISHFTEEADVEESSFRIQFATQVGGSANPDVVHVKDTAIYFTRGGRQTVAVWFDEDHVFILSIRDEYAQPRSLLRELLEVDL